MKTIFAILIAGLLPFTLQGQITLYLGHHNVSTNGLIEIPVKANGLDNFISMQFSLNWNPDILEYQSVDDLTTHLPNFFMGDMGVADASIGTLSMAWIEPFIQCVATVPDGTTIFTVTLRAVGGVNDLSGLTISETEVIDCNFTPVPIVADNGSVLIPVTLKSFTATPQKRSVLLQWVIEQEENLAGYELQRSLDAIQFSRITWQEAVSPQLGEFIYDFHDSDLACSRTYYYRLKIVELNGTAEYSDVVTAKTVGWGSVESLSVKNPFSEQLIVKSCEALGTNIYLYNLTGELVLAENNNGTTEIRLNTSHLPPGIYFLRVNNDTQKLIKH